MLDRFGANGRLKTRLYARRRHARRGHTLKGSLVIVGAGDPALASVGFARRNDLPLTWIANLASDVRKAGIRRVTGAIRADDTVFDRRRGVPTSGVDASGELGPLSGLSYNSGFAGGHYAAEPGAGRGAEAEAPAARAGSPRQAGHGPRQPAPRASFGASRSARSARPSWRT